MQIARSVVTKKALADISVIKPSAQACEQLCAIHLSDFYMRGIRFKAFSTQCKNSIKKSNSIDERWPM